MVFIELRQGEGESITGPRIMALKAFGPAGVVPGLLTAAPWSVRIRNGEGTIRPGRAYQRRVGLLVVPGIAIAPPSIAVEVENLRLEPAAAPGIATFHLQRKRLSQHAVL